MKLADATRRGRPSTSMSKSSAVMSATGRPRLSITTTSTTTRSTDERNVADGCGSVCGFGGVCGDGWRLLRRGRLPGCCAGGSWPGDGNDGDGGGIAIAAAERSDTLDSSDTWAPLSRVSPDDIPGAPGHDSRRPRLTLILRHTPAVALGGA